MGEKMTATVIIQRKEQAIRAMERELRRMIVSAVVEGMKLRKRHENDT